MEVIEVRPKGIYVKMEFSLEELNLLMRAMGMSTVAANLADKDQKRAHDFFVNDFYGLIKDVTEDLNKNGSR